MNKQTERGTYVEPKVWESAVVKDYSDKFIEDCYIDAYQNMAEGKSFCLELVMSVTQKWFAKDELGFKCIIRIFETPMDMYKFITENGEERIIEIFYSKL